MLCSWEMQILGALIVAAGVCLAAAPSDASANVFQQVLYLNNPYLLCMLDMGMILYEKRSSGTYI